MWCGLSRLVNRKKELSSQGTILWRQQQENNRWHGKIPFCMKCDLFSVVGAVLCSAVRLGMHILSVSLPSGPSNWPNPKCSGLINECAQCAPKRQDNPMTNLVTKMEYLLKQYSCMKHTPNNREKTKRKKKLTTKQTKRKQDRFDWGKVVKKVRSKEPNHKIFKIDLPW